MRVFIKLALLAQINYIGNFIGHIVVEILSQAITLLFLVTVYSYTDSIKGWTFDSSVFVFYLAIIVVMTAECFTTSINSYYMTLARGRLDPYLTLPVHRVQLMVLRWSEPGYLIPVAVLLAFWPLVDPNWHRSLTDWALGAVTLGLGVSAIVLTFALMSLATLVTQRLTPVDFMISEFGHMLFLPIGVYPSGAWRSVIGIGFPMLFGASAAAAIFVKDSFTPAIALAIGVVGLAALHWRIERWLLRSYSYPGS